MRHRIILVCVLWAILSALSLSATTGQELPGDLLQRAAQLREACQWEQALADYRQFLEDNPQHEASVLAHFAAGECLYNLQRYSEAVEQYQVVYNNHPAWSDVAVAYLRAGTSQFHMGNYAEAERTLSAALQEHTQSTPAPRIAYWLGEALYQQGKRTSAIEAYQKSLDLGSQSDLAPYALYSIATIQSETAPAKAIQTFHRLMDTFPENDLNAEAQFRVGKLCERSGRYERALTAYRKVMGDFPDSEFAARAMLGVASVYYSRGEYERAGKQFEKVAENYPGSEPGIRASLRAADTLFARKLYEQAARAYAAVAEQAGGQYAASARYWAAVSRQRAGSIPAAIDAFEKFIQDNPDDSRLTDAYLRLAGLYMEDNAFTKAQETYGTVAQIATDDTTRLTGRFGELWARWQQNQSPPALDALTSFVLEQPKSDIAANNALRVADLQLSAKNPEAARKLADLVIENHSDYPDMAEAFIRRAQALLMAGQKDAALKTYQSIPGQYPDSRWADVARSALVELRIEDGQPAEAAQLLEEIQPDGSAAESLPRLHYLLGEAYFDAEKWEEAIRTYRRAYRLNPSGPWADVALMGLGDARLASDQPVEAISTYQKVLAEFGNSSEIARAHVQLGNAHVRLGQHKQAAAKYTTALEMKPEASWAPDVAFALAEAYADASQPVAAIRALKRLVESHPDSDLAPEALLWAGELRYQQANFTAAATLYRRLLDEYPDSELTDEAEYKLGWSLLKGPDNEKTLDHFLAAAAEADDPAVAADARLQAGYILMNTEDYSRAAEVLEPATGTECPQAPSILHLLAQAHLADGRSQKAIPLLQRLIRQYPDYTYRQRARLRLARAYSDTGTPDEAQRILHGLRRSEDAEIAAEASLEMAGLRQQAGNSQRAVTLYLQVADEAPTDTLTAEALFAAGGVYEKMEKMDRAIEVYQRVIDKYPDQKQWADRAEERLHALSE